MSSAYIHIRLRRSTSIAVIFSLLVHVLMLFILSRQDLFNQQLPPIEQRTSISVRLNPVAAAKPKEAAPVAEVTPTSPPTPPRKTQTRKTKPLPSPAPVKPKVIATAKPATAPLPEEQLEPTPSPAVPPQPAALDPSQFPDMASYLKAVREQRGDTGNAGEASRAKGISEDDARTAKIQRNLQRSGTNGIFQISSMDAHTATFSFRGWRNEYSYSHREVYQVDAGLDGDIRRAVVRKMIEIIRRYYTGDFNWQSYRLGRVVVLSARIEDNDGLEDFLMQEFFGMQGIPAG